MSQLRAEIARLKREKEEVSVSLLRNETLPVLMIVTRNTNNEPRKCSLLRLKFEVGINGIKSVDGLMFVLFQTERKFNSRIYDLKDRLEQSHSTNRSMQNYVQFLKSSYANVFGDSTIATSSPAKTFPY